MNTDLRAGEEFKFARITVRKFSEAAMGYYAYRTSLSAERPVRSSLSPSCLQRLVGGSDESALKLLLGDETLTSTAGIEAAWGREVAMVLDGR